MSGARGMIDFLRQLPLGAIANNRSRLASRLRSRLMHTSCYLDTAVTITNWSNFLSGDECALYHGTYVLNDHGRMEMGRNTHLGAMCYVNVNQGLVRIGDDVAVGPHTCIIAYSNHYKIGRKITEERIQQDIHIGNNVFVGANCTILPGTQVADNVIIGAGSVVKGVLEENAIYAGVPCKKLRSGWYA